MRINPYLRKELVSDLRFCANKIIEEQDLQRKIYFFQRTYYEAGKIMDINYDPQLAFIQFTLEVTAGTVTDRVGSVTEGDTAIPLIEGLFEGIAKNLNELANEIEKDEDTYECLQKIVELAYVTTASGYHQYLTGRLKL